MAAVLALKQAPGGTPTARWKAASNALAAGNRPGYTAVVIDRPLGDTMNVLDPDALPGRLPAAGFAEVKMASEPGKRLELSAVKPLVNRP
ncbi:hypothetical protein [Amycolatopsis benzoatilytica]|uniref:hypothetical protein n=1 Tax=Amycolatopsis benzoatilytica TaxID=346045 RepID=UPI00036EBFE7|nr:hypothetical protein [Amycolatopsis benzoatilytica]